MTLEKFFSPRAELFLIWVMTTSSKILIRGVFQTFIINIIYHGIKYFSAGFKTFASYGIWSIKQNSVTP